MDLTAAASLAMILSFVAFGTGAIWYAVPRMRVAPVAAAITPFCGSTRSATSPSSCSRRSRSASPSRTSLETRSCTGI